jgi:glycosyltransferase involved in cell wall biosynthesis
MALSVIVITRDSEAVIGRCLDSVSWADEIVVVDSGSTDRTLEICRDHCAKVQTTPDWPGFGPQKNRALDLATGSWVLSLDSDEWITPELRAGIERAMAAPGGPSAFMMPRSSSFCGRFMRHSGWWPDYVVRLFRRGSARFSDDLVHERVIVNGTTRKLTAPILHEAARDLHQMVDKTNHYSTASAVMRHREGRHGSLTAAILHGLWAFLRTYIFRLGFLDGREGFLLAVINAENSYYRYAKLMLLEKKSDEQSTAHDHWSPRH